MNEAAAELLENPVELLFRLDFGLSSQKIFKNDKKYVRFVVQLLLLELHANLKRTSCRLSYLTLLLRSHMGKS